MFNKIEKELIKPLTDEEIFNDSTGMTKDERNNLG